VHHPPLEETVRRIGNLESRVEAHRVMRRVGQAIRVERGRLRYTIDDLAAYTGFSTATISRFERGDRAPRVDQLVRIAGALDISVFRLIEGADDRECQRCELGRSSHVLVCADAGFAAKLGGHTTPAMERRLYELGDE